MNAEVERLPVTILTGFLGAGKTTLLNRILHERHGLRLAVIENEFGSESIDADILVRDATEEIVQLDNGCLCCNVRGDLLRALAELARRRAARQFHFDRVVIETSGLADPGPVAQSLSADPATAASFYLDCIVTVVDALHGPGTLGKQPEARAQVAYADRIVLSKTDLVPATREVELCKTLQALNPVAGIEDRLDGGDLAGLLCAPPGGRFALEAAGETADETASETALHDAELGTLTFTTHRPFHPAHFEHFLAAMVEICGTDLFRCKGVLWIDGCEHKIVLQGVQLTMRVLAGAAWSSATARRSKLVLIGRALPIEELRDSLHRCLADADSFDADTPAIAYTPIGTKPRGWLR